MSLSIEDSPIWHPYTPIPHVGVRQELVRASGSYVFDSEGRSYLDATSSWWSNLHGHGHPELVKALADQASQMDHVMMSPHWHQPANRLAERLISMTGNCFAKVFFSDDGSTAVETAMKIALQYWQLVGQRDRTEFLSLDLGYHGDTLGAVGVGAIDDFHAYFRALSLRKHSAATPYCYRCPEGLKFPSCNVKCAESAEKLLETHGNRIAAAIIEPVVLGAAGMLMYPKEYLERWVRACHRAGVLVIFDEVFTGFYRTGPAFVSNSVNEKPDLICLSKGLTAGMIPMGATLSTKQIFQAFVGGPGRTLYHGHTFCGNPIGCSVALKSIELLESDECKENRMRITEMFAELAPRFTKLEYVGDVRHTGAVFAIELVQDKGEKKAPVPKNGPGWKIAMALWEKGIWIRPMGNTLYIIPPYSIEEEELRGALDLLYTECQFSKHFEGEK